MIEVTQLAGAQAPEARRFEDCTVRVGRHPRNHLVFKARHVSAHHGEITLTAGGASYRDLQTPNGSFVRRGEALIGVDAAHGFQVELEEGDELFLGDPSLVTGLTVRIVRQPESSDDGPPGFKLEVLSRLDVSDESKLQRLTSTFDRHVLLALQQHVARTARSQRLSTILESFAEAVFDYCPKATHVSIYLRHGGETKPTLALLQTRGVTNTAPTPLSTTVWNQIRARREAFSFEITDPTFESSESLKSLAVHAGMCAPLWAGDTLHGLVQVDGRGDRRVPFDTRDLEVLAVFASQLSVSIENSRLHNELEDTVVQLRSAQSEMQRLAFQDPVTGLSNRRLFQDRLAHAVRLARRHGHKVALLYLDLDGFKRVNDSFGHDAGDNLLKTVADRLRGCLRDQDTVARVGGDEFAAILGDVTNENAVRVVARKILDALREPTSLPQATVSVTACIGVALAPDDESSVPELIRKADLAMYRAKAQGRDSFRFYKEDMNLETARRSSLAADLRAALRRGSLTQYFQPIVSLSESRVGAFEALVRWDHPAHGPMLPDELRRLADELGLGLGDMLAKWTLEAACASAIEFKDPRLSSVRMAVSISARTLASREFPRTLRKVFETTGIDPARLALQISERALSERPDKRLERIKSLKRLGVSLCIEDFGAGYVTLRQLTHLPVDTLKLDSDLVSGIRTSAADERAAAGLIALAHNLGMRAVANGVETWAQLEFLKSRHCDFAQGPLFGRATSPAKLASASPEPLSRADHPASAPRRR